MGRRTTLLSVGALVALQVLVVVLAVRQATTGGLLSADTAPSAHTSSAAPSGGQSGGSPPEGSQSPSPSPSGQATPSPSSTPSSSPSPSGSTAMATGDAEIRLAVSDQGTVLRAVRGRCETPGQAKVAVSTDLGRSFTPARLQDRVAEVLAVFASAEQLTVVGLDAECSPGTYTSTDAGASWTVTEGPTEMWHLLSEPDTTEVHGPSGQIDTGCQPVSLSAMTSGVIRVLCESGTVLGTGDNGETWPALGALAGGVDIRYVTSGDGYGLAATDSCPAAVERTEDGGLDWEGVTCLQSGPPQAVAAAGDIVLAQAGGALHVSTDGGQTWSSR